MEDSGLSDIGLIGLAVMGQNLALNIADHGYVVSVYNRTVGKTEEFVKRYGDGVVGKLVAGLTMGEFVKSLKRPRKVIILVKAGVGTDEVIRELSGYLEKGDIIIDGGNAEWKDTMRRGRELGEKGIRFLGSGVSGGEEGARFGPSLMVGGEYETWKEVEAIWKGIAAKVDEKSGKPLMGGRPGKPVVGGVACADYVGESGAGHYVKMVHNGIEYADMQLICEAYHLMKDLLKMSGEEMSEVFKEWNRGVLDSFLIEITADILRQKDPKTGKLLVDVILDVAGQKGTGKWTAVSALDMGSPAATLAEAVYARCLSSMKEERVKAAGVLKGPEVRDYSGQKGELIKAIEDALYCSKICVYAQGFQLIGQSQKEYGWRIDMGRLAQIWRGGCIIRAAFLQKITEAYGEDRGLDNLMLATYFREAMMRRQGAWRKVVALAAENGIPVPTFSSALAYYDGYRAGVLPHNLLQGQRDYFGSHTYERVDGARGEYYHFEWSAAERKEIKIEK